MDGSESSNKPTLLERLSTLLLREPEDREQLIGLLHSAYERGKSHALIVVAEGSRNNAAALAHYFEEHRQRLGFELRVTTLGHVQRGGAPSAYDRLLATRFGAAATEYLANGKHGILIGQIKGEIAATPLAEVVTKQKSLDLQLLELAHVLAK